MAKSFSLKASLLAAGLLVLPFAHAADNMPRADYSAQKDRIEADHKGCQGGLRQAIGQCQGHLRGRR